MDKPEPLSDEEITAIWNRFIKQPYDGRTLSAIISHTAQAVAARYEARENHRARTVAKLVGDLASMAASREQWKSCAETLIGAGERREARIAELERERDALRADAKVPAGWCLVPEVPTDDMLVAGQEEWVLGRRGSATEECEEAKAIYGAMVRMAQFERQPELFGGAAQEKR